MGGGEWEPMLPHDSPEWQIWAFSSGAPPPLGTNATVLGVNGTVLRNGTNGWTCKSDNARPVPEGGWPNRHTAMPICTDDEGLKFLNATGDTANLDRDAFAWMLGGDVGEDNTTPGVLDKEDAPGGPSNWIESGPHLMLFPRDGASLEGMPTDFHTGAPYVMWRGNGFAHVMIPIDDRYYDFQDPQRKAAA